MRALGSTSAPCHIDVLNRNGARRNHSDLKSAGGRNPVVPGCFAPRTLKTLYDASSLPPLTRQLHMRLTEPLPRETTGNTVQHAMIHALFGVVTAEQARPPGVSAASAGTKPGGRAAS